MIDCIADRLTGEDIGAKLDDLSILEIADNGKVKLDVEKFESKENKWEYYRLVIYTKKIDGSWIYKSRIYRGKYKDII